MTYAEIVAIAARNGTLRWSKSGTVEHLRITKKGVVLARPIKQPKSHPIKKPANDAVNYDCIEVDSVSKQPVGGTQ